MKNVIRRNGLAAQISQGFGQVISEDLIKKIISEIIEPMLQEKILNKETIIINNFGILTSFLRTTPNLFFKTDRYYYHVKFYAHSKFCKMLKSRKFPTPKLTKH